VLVVIHAYYQRQIDIARQVDWVYDFALPPPMMHALIRQS
jgi:sucrose phosphorylase